MIELFDVSDNVLGFKMDGSISPQEFDEIVKKVDKKVIDAEGRKLRVYAEIVELGMIPPEKFIDNIKFKFKHFKDFEKEAVVSDKKWLNTFISVTEKFFPSIEAKTFSFEEKDEALKWVQS
ncbi:MAG: STAS/SEC14 domain-containing protein [Candidatus Caenarcaniphilales bacterium]|nr:STAS/SEC14 domain-containing protein [Candidatus Caenarcaniphilales bacterium]